MSGSGCRFVRPHSACSRRQPVNHAPPRLKPNVTQAMVGVENDNHTMNRSRRAVHVQARHALHVVPGTMPLLVACALAAACSSGTVASVRNNAVGQGLAPANLPAFFDCLRESGRTIVAAHRGGPSAGFPENAVLTFENTLRQVPAVLELDIARTRDGVLVLMHDETVDRTTTGTGRVGDLTLGRPLRPRGSGPVCQASRDRIGTCFQQSPD